MCKSLQKYLHKIITFCLVPVLLFGPVVPAYAQNNPQTEISGSTGPTGVENRAKIVLKLANRVDAVLFARTNNLNLKKIGPLNYVIITLPQPATADALAALRRLPGVLSAQPGKTYKISDTGATSSAGMSSTPSTVSTPDPAGGTGSASTENQAGLSGSVSATTPVNAPNATGSSGPVTDPYYSEQWALTDIEAPQAWALGATGKGITVAVVDTGVDLSHPDLRDNLLTGSDGQVIGYDPIVDSSDPQDLRDDNGHGTHVAGIIAGARNGKGVVGVAYEAKIMPIKAMDANGDGDDVDIAAGIVWAADHGAKIVNLSLGSDTEDGVLQAAIQYAAGKGVLIVAAAGNFDSRAGSAVTYPAADPGVLAVTSVDSRDKISSFSSTGPQVALAAPGEDIVSAYWSWRRGSGYASMSGTSMASPLVSGTAALVWAQHPAWTVGQVRGALESAARHTGQAGRNNQYGYGIINAYRSVAVARDPVTLTAPAQVSFTGASVAAPDNALWQLAVPPLAFDATQNISINSVAAPAAFPAGITAGSQAYDVEWGSANISPQRMLTLSAPGTPPAGSSTATGYFFRWSGSRWLLVGGGQTTAISAGIFEPGIYRIGYLPPPGTRLAGADRLQTAVQVAKEAFPTGADTVILARADDFPDALAGAPLAYKLHAPILLTFPNQIDPAVLDTIRQFNPQKIMILGGTGAVSAAIEGTLKQVAPVQRLAGANRFATAAAIAQAVGTTGGAVVVNGENFPDALALAPVAAQKGLPVLLTSGKAISSETDQALRKIYATGTICGGGTAVLTQDVLDKLPAPQRLAGPDRYGTAAAVLEKYPPQGRLVYVATGEDFPDALTGGVLAASRSSDIVLVPPAGPTVREHAVVTQAKAQAVIALGGQAVIPDSMLSKF